MPDLFEKCTACEGSGERPDLTWSGAPKCPCCQGDKFVEVGLTSEQFDIYLRKLGRMTERAKDAERRADRHRIAHEHLVVVVGDKTERLEAAERRLLDLAARLGIKHRSVDESGLLESWWEYGSQTFDTLDEALDAAAEEVSRA